MTDETRTTERPTTNQPVDDNSASEQPLLAEWPPSTYVTLFAFLYLGGTALAMITATSAVANRLVRIGVVLLVISLFARLLEHAAGKSLHSLFERLVAHIRSTAGRSASLPNDGGEHVARLSRSFVPGRFTREQARSLVGLVVVFTFVGGLLVVLQWWMDPAKLVSGSFLIGWLFALGSLTSVYVALGLRRR